MEKTIAVFEFFHDSFLFFFRDRHGFQTCSELGSIQIYTTFKNGPGLVFSQCPFVQSTAAALSGVPRGSILVNFLFSLYSRFCTVSSLKIAD